MSLWLKHKKIFLDLYGLDLRVFLVIGSASEDNIRRFILKRFNIQYDSTKDTYEVGDLIYVNCNFHRLSFDFDKFKAKINELKSERMCIYLIENLIPMPETLANDLNVLGRVFSKKELRNHLEICFTGRTENMEEVKKSFALNDGFFSYLDIHNQSDELRFVNNNFFKLDEN